MLFQEALSKFGFQKTSITRCKTGTVYNFNILRDDGLLNASLEALELIPLICLHEKLDYNIRAIKAGSQEIPLTLGPPQISFFCKYLGQRMKILLHVFWPSRYLIDSDSAIVLTITSSTDRDTCSLHLIEVNRILQCAGMQVIDDTRDLNYGLLVNQAGYLRDSKITTVD